MQWIECVERRNGTWGVLVSDDNQEAPLWHPATQLNKLIPATKSNYRRRLTTDLTSWQASSGNKYLAALGDKRELTDGQMVFSFRDDGTEYLVPAIVIIQALFRPLRHLAPWLFHPTSLELVSAPTADSPAFSATLTLDSGCQQYKEPVVAQALFTWAWAYASARRMWSSVYQHALQAKLGVTLPMGTVRAVFHGVARDNQVAVTEMRVMQITTTERSDLEVQSASKTFIFHRGVTPAPMERGAAEQQLLKTRITQAQPLTDAEWNAVKDILENEPRAYKRKHDPRLMLNGILARLVTGKPWRHSTYTVGDWHHASTSYHRWKIRGVWDEICARLCAVSQPIDSSYRCVSSSYTAL